MAVDSLNIDNIFTFLSEPGVNIFATDRHGNTLLHWALTNKFNNISTQRQIIEVLEMLLGKGIDINVKNRHSETVLHLAIDKMIKDVVQMLIKRGADLNVCDGHGNTLAYYFIDKICQRKVIGVKECLDFWDFLCRSGVDIHRENGNGDNALSIAAKESFIFDLIRCLITNSVDSINAGLMKLENTNEDTIIHKLLSCWITSTNLKEKIACKICLTKLITVGVNVNKKNNAGLSLLQLAFQQDDVRLMEMLVEHGADLNVFKGNNYFHKLCRAEINVSSEYKMELLMRADCDINAVDEEGQTPLYCASELNNVKMVEKLVKLGADVNCRGSHENLFTPLHQTAMDGRLNILKILIEAGANVNVRTASNYTPLLFACHLNRYDMVAALLEAGAHCSMDVVANDGEKALDVAIKNKNRLVTSKLLEYGVSIDDHATFRKIEELHGRNSNVHDNNIKRLAVELPSGGKYEFYAISQHYQEIYEKCLKEVEVLKAYKLRNNVSVYDFLRMDWNFRCSFIENKKLLRLINCTSSDGPTRPVKSILKVQFPLYHALISSAYNETVARRPLLEPAKFAWYNLTDIHLPEVCVLRILAHLPNEDLKVMIGGSKIRDVRRSLKRSSIDIFSSDIKKMKIEDN